MRNKRCSQMPGCLWGGHSELAGGRGGLLRTVGIAFNQWKKVNKCANILINTLSDTGLDYHKLACTKVQEELLQSPRRRR